MSSVRGRVELRVRYGETDQMGVVYHPNYLVWCEVGRTELIRELIMSYRDVEERGVLLAVAEATVRYKAPARYDDPIRVETWVSAVGSRMVTFEYAIYHAAREEELVSARTALASIDRSGRVVSMPTYLREALARGIA
jgi:acyl-CoA thioester hydrolase